MDHFADAINALRRRAATVRLAQLLPLVIIGAAALTTTAVYLYGMLRHTDGELTAPIDDVYIYYNYARHMAGGHWYQYNPGDGVSTGATSLLWTPIVALGYLIGFQGQSIIGWTLGLNVVLLFVYGVLLYRLSLLLLSSRPLATLIATAILLDGRVLWGFFAGMEIGLYHVLLLTVLYAFAAYQQSGASRWWRLWLGANCLLVLVRPEGSFLAGFAIVVFVAWRWLQTGARRGGQSIRRFLLRREWLLVSLPVVIWLVQWIALYVATGESTPNGLRVKSHLYQPDQTLEGVLVPSLKFYQDMVFAHFPWLFNVSLRHLIVIVFFAGVIGWCARELVRRRPGPWCLMALWFFGGLAIQSVVLNAAYHHGRYQMNYTFIFWLLFFAGTHLALRKLKIGAELTRWITGAVVGLFLVMMINTVVIFSQHFGKDCRAIRNQHVAMGQRVAELVPQDAAVGVNDAGAIAYVGQRYVYDVFGLTTNVAARWRHDGQACLWEQVAYLDPTTPPRRPDYFAIYPEWYPAILELGFLEELARVRIPEPNICGASTKALYSIDWSAFGDKSIPGAFRRTFGDDIAAAVDRLDIAYRPDEIAHGYRHWRNGQPSEWGSDLLRHQAYVGRSGGSPIVDGGRELAEREEMTVGGLDPAKPLLVVRRTDGAQAASRVLVNGRGAGQWASTRGAPKQFRDEVFEIVPGQLPASAVTLTFEVVAGPSSTTLGGQQADRPRQGKEATENKPAVATPSYRAYYYWFFQPRR